MCHVVTCPRCKVSVVNGRSLTRGMCWDCKVKQILGETAHEDSIHHRHNLENTPNK